MVKRTRRFAAMVRDNIRFTVSLFIEGSFPV